MIDNLGKIPHVLADHDRRALGTLQHLLPTLQAQSRHHGGGQHTAIGRPVPAIAALLRYQTELKHPLSGAFPSVGEEQVSLYGTADFTLQLFSARAQPCWQVKITDLRVSHMY